MNNEPIQLSSDYDALEVQLDMLQAIREQLLEEIAPYLEEVEYIEPTLEDNSSSK